MIENKDRLVFSIFKEEKPFNFKDLILYFLIIIFFLSVLLALFFSKKTDPVTGFYVEIGKKTVIEYNYATLDFSINNSYKDKIKIEKDESSTIVKIFHNNDFSEYTELYIDNESKSVYVLDTTCPNKTCEHSGNLSDYGTIVCIPYNLKILPLNNTDLIVVGGGN